MHGDPLTAPDLWQYLLTVACAQRASDIHLEPTSTGLCCRLRIDGVLSQPAAVSAVAAAVDLGTREALCAHIKVYAGMDIAQKRLPQDGRFNFVDNAAHTWDCRVSTLPTVHGEKLVARLLSQQQTDWDLTDLGYSPDQLQHLLEALASPNGLILMTGPTGCGKTRSLHSCLRRLNADSVNICAVEDPVEMRIAGIQQVQINEKAGLTFVAALRAFLRQDPDIIMVGEIRDDLTATVSAQAAQTGHLVLSTLHTNDAPSALLRLTHMGLAPLHIRSSVRLVTAQRLVRRLCPLCKETVTPTYEQSTRLARSGFPTGKRLSIARGCEACVHGYLGRIASFRCSPSPSALETPSPKTPTRRPLRPSPRRRGSRPCYKAAYSYSRTASRHTTSWHAMFNFKWSAQSWAGEHTHGSARAASADALRGQLQDAGWFAVTVSRAEWALSPATFRVQASAAFGHKRTPSLTTPDQLWLVAQLGLLLDAGLSLIDAITLLQETGPSHALATVLHRIEAELQRGQALSQALSALPKAFDALTIGVIAAAEEGGQLAIGLRHLAGHLRKSQHMRAQLRAALTYPTVVACVAAMVIGVILVWVIPGFEAQFAREKIPLPWLTQQLIQLSADLRSHGWLLLMGSGLLWHLMHRQNQSLRGQLRLERILFLLPRVGTWLLTTHSAAFAQTLSSLLQAGLPLRSALSHLQAALQSASFRAIAAQAKNDVEQGVPLHTSLRGSGRVLPLLVQLCAVGEATGKLDQLLDNAANALSDEADRSLKLWASLLEPIAILILGLIVGTMVLAMYWPIFQIGQTI